MRKNQIKQLAETSYTKDELDEKKVSRILKSLKREQLKAYIKNLRTLEAKKSVIITVPDKIGLGEKKRFFSKIYPDKRIVFDFDPTLLTGIRVVDSDNVYELSLKDLLKRSLRRGLND